MNMPKIAVRPYRESEFRMIEAWWHEQNEVAPLPSMMPIDSSFIAEIDGKPALAITIYLTNCKEVAYLENFVGNPAMKGSDRRVASHILLDHVQKFAKARGFRNLLCMAHKPQLERRYVELGYRQTLGGVSTFLRNL